jgi:hypothetical protein
MVQPTLQREVSTSPKTNMKPNLHGCVFGTHSHTAKVCLGHYVPQLCIGVLMFFLCISNILLVFQSPRRITSRRPPQSVSLSFNLLVEVLLEGRGPTSQGGSCSPVKYYQDLSFVNTCCPFPPSGERLRIPFVVWRTVSSNSD